MLSDPCWQNVRRNNATPCDRCSGNVQENITSLNGYIIETRSLLIIYNEHVVSRRLFCQRELPLIACPPNERGNRLFVDGIEPGILVCPFLEWYVRYLTPPHEIIDQTRINRLLQV